MDDDTLKLFAGAAFAIASLMLLVYVGVYVLLPIAVIGGGWVTYAYIRDHPSTVGNRLRGKAQQLHAELAGKFPSPKEFAKDLEVPEIAEELYAGEVMNIPSPPPGSASAIDLGRYVDELSRIASTVSERSLEIAKRAVRDSLSAFGSYLPDFPDGSFSTIPADAILSPGRAVEDTISPFFADGSPFTRLQDQLTRNLHRASEIPHTPDNYDSPKLVLPSKSDLPARRLVKSYLANTPLERMFYQNISVGLPEHLRFEGTWVIAPPGRGKTTLLSALLMDDLTRVAENRASIVVMDSKGDLIDHLRQFKGFAPGHQLHEKLVLIEPSPQLALNPLDVGVSAAHTIDLVEYILSGFLDAETTPKQGGVLRRVIIAVHAIPNASFKTFLDFLDDWRKFEEHIGALPADDRDYFQSGKFDETDIKRTRNEIYWRIDALMTKVPGLRDMFKAPQTLIDIAKEIDDGKIIIIDNSEKSIGAGQEFFGRLFLALILGAATQRSGRADSEKLPCFVYLDEAQTVIARDPTTASILDRCRSQKIALILAHQRLSQIKLDDVKDALGNCAIRLANSDEDAKALAPKLRTNEETLRGIPRGHFMLFMRDITPRPLEVSVPNAPVSDWPKMAADEMRTVRALMRERYCYKALPQPEPEPEPPPEPQRPQETQRPAETQPLSERANIELLVEASQPPEQAREKAIKIDKWG